MSNTGNTAQTKHDHRITIGLEVHVQLKTESKMFCGCSTAFGAPPNTHVCPVCSGLPGSLPVMNKRAFELAVKTAIALGCEIAQFTKFDRKSYYYPDLPKNYQISQYDMPLSNNGFLEIDTSQGKRRIGVTRVHLEEDAGKLVHQGKGASAVNLNRTGIPLMEIVSEPDIHAIEELHEYLAGLKLLLTYLDVSNCNMEEGNIRADANISVQIDSGGKEVSSPISEIKNMNSFSACEKAMAFEAKRLYRRLKDGVTMQTHPKETRGWDEARSVTVGQRQKEEASDYRYFPDPDLAPVVMNDDWLGKIRAELPELPQVRKKRFIEEYGLSEYEVDVLLSEKALADRFEKHAKTKDARTACVWVTQHLLRESKSRNIPIADFPVTPEREGELISFVADGTINASTGTTVVFPEMIETGKSAKEIIDEKGLAQVSDAGALDAAVDAVIEKFPKDVADYRAGKEGVINFLMGMVMKETRGKANPQMVRELLQKKLG